MTGRKESTAAILDRTQTVIGTSVEVSQRTLPLVKQAFWDFEADMREQVSNGKHRGIKLRGPDVIIQDLQLSDFSPLKFTRLPIAQIIADLWPAEDLTIGLFERITVVTRRGSYFTIEFTDEDVSLNLRHFTDSTSKQLLAERGPIERTQAALEFLKFVNDLVIQRRARN